MDEAFKQALENVFLDGNLWLIMLAAAFFGLFIGAVPGLTATMAVALLVPFTFWLDPIAGAGGDRHDQRLCNLRRRHTRDPAAHSRHARLGGVR